MTNTERDEHVANLVETIRALAIDLNTMALRFNLLTQELSALLRPLPGE
jgi:hypothetical protein